ncbi:MAG: hypothetical protein KF897_07675 [Opitutaceae bacterium]|nr:hypothetical protein [Opitutaceae bacterium]
MKTSLHFQLAFVVAVFLGGSTLLMATESPQYGLAAQNHIYAQKLVNDIASSHPELVAVGLHCVPPGDSRQSIVASTLNVIGKPSDPEDIVHGSTTIAPSNKAPKLGIMMPLHDRAAQEIGSLALQFKYQKGDDQVKLLAQATVIRDRVAREIPDLAGLFATQP